MLRSLLDPYSAKTYRLFYYFVAAYFLSGSLLLPELLSSEALLVMRIVCVVFHCLSYLIIVLLSVYIGKKPFFTGLLMALLALTFIIHSSMIFIKDPNTTLWISTVNDVLGCVYVIVVFTMRSYRLTFLFRALALSQVLMRLCIWGAPHLPERIRPIIMLSALSPFILLILLTYRAQWMIRHTEPDFDFVRNGLVEKE